ncbi:MAG: glycosyltransferase family 4 protein [bacterium]
MRIAILLHGGVDRSGERHVIHGFLWLIERLAGRHEVHVFSRDQEPDPDDWTLLGADVHNTGTKRGWRTRLFSTFANEHKVAPFHVIHGIFPWGGTYGALLGARYHLPVLFHAAGGEFVDLPDIAYGTGTTSRGRAALRIALLGARRVTVASAPMQRLAAAHGVDAEVVPIGVALDRWPPMAPRHRDPRRPARLLHVGDLRPVKDQPTLLAAMNLLREHDAKFQLDMVGVDTMNGTLQRGDVARTLGNNIRWHGHLCHEALRRLMSDADVLLVTSRHEAGPIVALEAAVLGVPTVGTAVGHVSEWAPRAAIAVPVGDAEGLARETIALLDDEERRLDIANEAQRRAVSIDADYTATAFERIYDELQDR